MAKKKRAHARAYTRVRKKRTRQLTDTQAVERIRGFTGRRISLTVENAQDYLLRQLSRVRKKFSRKKAGRWGAALFIAWESYDEKRQTMDEGVRTLSRVGKTPELAIDVLADAISFEGFERVERYQDLEEWIIGFRFDKYVARRYVKGKKPRKIKRQRTARSTRRESREQKRHGRKILKASRPKKKQATRRVRHRVKRRKQR